MASEEEQEARKAFRHFIPEDAREHLKAARQEFRSSYEGLLPPEFIEHRRAARREFLLAARSLIDSALERIERKSQA